MTKLFWLLATVLYVLYDFSEGLECYHCYVDSKNFSGRDGKFVPCNTDNLTASNTWVCPEKNAKCIYQVVEFQSNKMRQTWRTCSKGTGDPCDPNNLPPGMSLLQCKSCETDKCNLFPPKEEKENEYTLNINANINLNIRQ